MATDDDAGLLWDISRAHKWACPAISQRSFRNLIARGEIPSVRMGRRILIPREGLYEWARKLGLLRDGFRGL